VILYFYFTSLLPTSTLFPYTTLFRSTLNAYKKGIPFLIGCFFLLNFLINIQINFSFLPGLSFSYRKSLFKTDVPHFWPDQIIHSQAGIDAYQKKQDISLG